VFSRSGGACGRGRPAKTNSGAEDAAPRTELAIDTIESWRQEPRASRLGRGLRETWQPSDISALKTRAQSLRQGPREMSTTRIRFTHR